MKHVLFLMLTLCCTAPVRPNHQETLLIFNGMHPESLDDVDGMNVAHQVLTAMIDQASPMVIAVDVWDHILQRRDRFRASSLSKKSLQGQVERLVQEVNQKIKQSNSVTDLNNYFNSSWYGQNYPELARLNQDQKKSAMFDFFCSQVDVVAKGWTGYLPSSGYLLLLPKGCVGSSFHLDSCKKLTGKQLVEQRLFFKKILSLYKIDLLLTVEGLLKSNNISWIFYLTGHGHHADQQQKESKIAGMTSSGFQHFLHFLQGSIKTKLLVYSSCFSSGVHLIRPYQELSGVPLLLDFPVIVTCLTDAPVYVFGTASGLKLPPYDDSLRLEASDIAFGKLPWYLMQKFNHFVSYAKQIDLSNLKSKNKFKEIAQSVMLYQECDREICNITKLENIPLIRLPQSIFFVPIDAVYVDCIVHSSKNKTVDGKHGLLWYIKQYEGVISLKGKIPQFVSMTPGDGAVWIGRIEALSFSFKDLIAQAFFSVEDMHHLQIFLCDQLVCRDKKNLRELMIIPTSRWLPGGFVVGDAGWCCYRQERSYFGCEINKSGGLAEPYQLNSHQKKNAKYLWSLLKEDSKNQQDLPADQLWLVANLDLRRNKIQELLAQCVKSLVCQG